MAIDKKTTGGVLMGSVSGADPSFYSQKRAVEKKLGRVLSLDDFVNDHYVPPDTGTASGTSIFDPVLCELAYRWFCPAGGVILDPFSGGSVRGIVASKLGFRYTGVDLSTKQIIANREQGAKICEPYNLPTWINGNSLDVEALVPEDFKADFIFSCPPYADLEVYSDDPGDLSNMPYNRFVEMYSQIIAATVRLLKTNRFACFVVGDVRDDAGFYRNFPAHTVQAFIDAGANLYNEMVLLTAIGGTSMRVIKQFNASRKAGKVHQNVFVFCKGDPKKATAAIGTEIDA